jgi:hypothetical protein
MSLSTAIIPNPNCHSSKVAFCDKNYKSICVMADKVSKKCVEIFCRILSAVCSLFSSRLALRYYCLARLEQFKNHWSFTYQRYGDKVVDFASYTFTHIKDRLPEGTTELERIKHIYGADKIDSLCRMFPEELLGNLARSQVVTGGCCFGMSVDFISAYLHQRQAGKNALESVKAIAPQFENGASDNAEICQIFYNAFTHIATSKQIAEAKEKGRIWLENERENLLARNELEPMTKEQILEKVAQLKAEVLERVGEFRRQLFNEYHDTSFEDITKIATIVHIAASHPLIIESNINEAQLEAAMRDLPAGAYEVSIAGANVSGAEGARNWAHATVYIKTGEGQDIVFDPNQATFVVKPDQSSAQVWDRIKMLQGRGDELGVVFTPFHMA